jgi:hypothetical protein
MPLATLQTSCLRRTHSTKYKQHAQKRQQPSAARRILIAIRETRFNGSKFRILTRRRSKDLAKSAVDCGLDRSISWNFDQMQTPLISKNRTPGADIFGQG